MAIVKWDPLHELQLMQDQMSRLLESSRERSFAAPFDSQGWQPAADIYDDGQAVVVKLDLPEVEQEQIDITIDGDQLVVRGERLLAESEQKRHFLRIERSYGPFQRTFTLPAGIDEEQISATCERGVLRIVLPKRGSAGSRRIELSPS